MPEDHPGNIGIEVGVYHGVEKLSFQNLNVHKLS